MPSPGEIIKRLRESRNMSKADLARALGITRAAVGKWEDETSDPSLTSLIEITKFFDIPLSEFGDPGHEHDLELKKVEEFLARALHGESRRTHKPR